MTIERIIFITVALLSIVSMLFIPKEKIRIALLSFIAFQTTTWVTSIFLVQFGKAVYPVREFVVATNVNFIPQFFLYPSIFMWFILLFPKYRSILVKITHYFIFVSLMVWFIYLTSKFTNIYRFPKASDYSILTKGYLRNAAQYAICHLYIAWFFKQKAKLKGDL